MSNAARKARKAAGIPFERETKTRTTIHQTRAEQQRHRRDGRTIAKAILHATVTRNQ
jgi:hypothetical protein